MQCLTCITAGKVGVASLGPGGCSEAGFTAESETSSPAPPRPCTLLNSSGLGLAPREASGAWRHPHPLTHVHSPCLLSFRLTLGTHNLIVSRTEFSRGHRWWLGRLVIS